MIRAIVAVIASYVVMFVLTFLAFTAAYMLLQADGSFKPGLFEASNTWIGTALVVNFVVSVIGGLICAAIAKGGQAPVFLALVVLVLGIALAYPSMVAQKANEGLARSGDVPMLEAMTKAQEPSWLIFSFPILGAAGVLIGSKLRRQR